MITITDSAQVYLRELLDKQDGDVLGIRIFITEAGTSKAETCIAYGRADDIKEEDEKMELATFTAYFDSKSLPFLKDALVDYSKDRMGGQLTIKAPNSKMPIYDENSSIEDKIKYVLFTDVNPSLASHGGDVSLLAVTEEGVAVLRFGGGCQGCSSVEMTLKEGVEKTLMESIPELTGVIDETDHTDRSSAYM